MAGHFDKTSPPPPFHLEEIAATACKTPGSLRQKADSFVTLSSEQVVACVKNIKERNPVYYTEKVAGVLVGALLTLHSSDSKMGICQHFGVDSRLLGTAI